MKYPVKHHEDGSITIGESSSHTRRVTLVTPTDRRFFRRGYVLWFGAYGATYLHVFADNLEEALDTCVDWIADHAPGLLADSEVSEEYQAALAEGLSEDEARERSEIDTTIAGNCGNYLHSWEWGILTEGISGRDLIALVTGEQPG